MRRPTTKEYAPFYATYVDVVPTGNMASLLRKNFKESKAIFEAWPEENGNWAYAEGKWSVKELIMHMIDTERVFAYRAMRVMRNDKTALPGFEQDGYVENSFVENRTIKDLLKEWKIVRENTLYLYKNCSEAQSKNMGTASGNPISPRALFAIMIGHELHHMRVFGERYLAK